MWTINVKHLEKLGQWAENTLLSIRHSGELVLVAYFFVLRKKRLKIEFVHVAERQLSAQKPNVSVVIYNILYMHTTVRKR